MATGGFKDSVLLSAIGLMDKKFNSKELRKPVFGAETAFLEKRGMLIPSVDAIRKAEQQTVRADYLERNAVAIGSTRSCTPSAYYGDTGTLDLSWTTYSHTAKTSIKIAENNTYDQLVLFQNDIYNRFVDLHTQIEADAVAYLEANRTGIQGNRTMNTWNGAADVMQVALADRDDYLNYIKTEMYQDNYRGTLMDIHTIPMMAMYRQQFAQGASNDENLQFQYPGFQHYDSAAITNGTGSVYGTSYIVEEGGIALLDWIPAINRNGNESKKGEVWTTMPDPFGYPLTWAVFITDGCANTTYSTGTDPRGATQDYVRTYEFSVDLSFNRAPLTVNAGQEVINKYELMTV